MFFYKIMFPSFFVPNLGTRIAGLDGKKYWANTILEKVRA